MLIGACIKITNLLIVNYYVLMYKTDYTYTIISGLTKHYFYSNGRVWLARCHALALLMTKNCRVVARIGNIEISNIYFRLYEIITSHIWYRCLHRGRKLFYYNSNLIIFVYHLIIFILLHFKYNSCGYNPVDIIGSFKKILALSSIILFIIAAILLFNIPFLALDLHDITYGLANFLAATSLFLLFEILYHRTCKEKFSVWLTLIAILFFVISVILIFMYSSIPCYLYFFTLQFKHIGSLAMFLSFFYIQLTIHYNSYFK